MNDRKDQDDRVLNLRLAGVFSVISALAGLDLVFDLQGGTSAHHLAVEAGLFLAGLSGAVWMAVRLRALAGRALGLEEKASALEASLEASRREAASWRAETKDLIEGLSGAIDRQLSAWALSPAEKEVALLLLKGLSHKEVGEVRRVGEATVRQQARALYKKAGLSGRNDLAAFFLEDLLGPRERTPTSTSPTAGP